MQVQRVGVEKGLGVAPLRGFLEHEAARKGVRDRGGLAHHVSELARGLERASGLRLRRSSVLAVVARLFFVSVPVNRRAFDVQRAPAHGGPGEPRHHARRRRVVDAVRLERGLAHVLHQVVARGDHHLVPRGGRRQRRLDTVALRCQRRLGDDELSLERRDAR